MVYQSTTGVTYCLTQQRHQHTVFFKKLLLLISNTMYNCISLLKLKTYNMRYYFSPYLPLSSRILVSFSMLNDLLQNKFVILNDTVLKVIKQFFNQCFALHVYNSGLQDFPLHFMCINKDNHFLLQGLCPPSLLICNQLSRFPHDH